MERSRKDAAVYAKSGNADRLVSDHGRRAEATEGHPLERTPQRAEHGEKTSLESK